MGVRRPATEAVQLVDMSSQVHAIGTACAAMGWQLCGGMRESDVATTGNFLHPTW